MCLNAFPLKTRKCREAEANGDLTASVSFVLQFLRVQQIGETARCCWREELGEEAELRDTMTEKDTGTENILTGECSVFTAHRSSVAIWNYDGRLVVIARARLSLARP